MKRVLQLLFMPCEGISGLISQAQERELSRSERFAVRLHSLYCRACRQYRRQLARLRQLLHRETAAGITADLQLGDQARQRITRALRDASGKGSSSDRGSATPSD